jgi:dolichol-phosphate mannosyltransferase
VNQFVAIPALPSATIVIPVFNEELNIEDVVIEADIVLSQITKRKEIIVINDGSSDKTGDILNRMTKNIPSLRVLHHPTNQGINFALVDGYTSASGDWIFFNSGDKQTPMSHMLKMWPFIDQYDLILGAFTKRNDPKIRIIFSKVYHRLVRFLFRLNYRNLNTIKLFRREVFDPTYPWSKNLCFDLELVLRATLNNFRVIEIEVEHFRRMEGKSTVLSVKNIVATPINLIVLWIKNVPEIVKYKSAQSRRKKK